MINTEQEIELNRILISKLLIENVQKKKNIKNISEVEFKVFSQFGEDGIIQYLINNVPLKDKSFIEFGVENYKESNTRFLLINNNWRGLIIDSSKENIEFIRSDSIYWKYNIKAICEFVNKDNINDIFTQYGFNGDIGLLSIDIDGNDYWVWEAINTVNPRIVICEYNSIFGNEYAVTIPYFSNFNRTKFHFSNLYFGASLPALYSLAKKKGYFFIGCNSAGNNAFFIRNDFSKYFREVSIKEGYVMSVFRESRNQNGQLSYLSGEERIEIIKHLDIYDLDKKKIVNIKDLLY